MKGIKSARTRIAQFCLTGELLDLSSRQASIFWRPIERRNQLHLFMETGDSIQIFGLGMWLGQNGVVSNQNPIMHSVNRRWIPVLTSIGKKHLRYLFRKPLMFVSFPLAVKILRLVNARPYQDTLAKSPY